MKHLPILLVVSLIPVSLTNAGDLDCATNTFHGTDRAKAKTSISSASIEQFRSLGEFIASLPADAVMMKHPGISTAETSGRVKEERRNVRLTNVFLYAYKREPDNDYHLIVGDDKTPRTYFNCEVSGIPTDNSAAAKALGKFRPKINEAFGDYCQDKYRLLKKPAPITIKGSLFYDIDHKPGVVGPQSMRPKTAWEIHPVTSLKFE